MDNVLKSGLAERGWALHEIDDAARQMDEGDEPFAQKMWQGVAFWGIMVVSIFANFVVSLVLIPIVMVFTSYYLVFALGLIGFAFGALLESIIKETERFSASKLLIPELFIPAIAMINIYIATELSNKVASMLLLSTPFKNPYVTSAIYVFAFMIPHFWRKYRSHRVLRQE